MQIKRAEYRSQNAEVRRQKSEDRIEKLKVKSKKSKVGSLGVVAFWILMFGIFLSGCNSKGSKSYDNSTMITYAELTLLYEKEKMVNKQTDSSYVIKVNEFFASKGLQQNEFKKRIETISKDEEEWKIFIQDVSTVMDSLKIVGITK